jgi:hypothetical protein
MKRALALSACLVVLSLDRSALAEESPSPLSITDLPRSQAEQSGQAPSLNHRSERGDAIHVLPNSHGQNARASNGLASAAANLAYHKNGSVVPHANVFAIYWLPASGHLQNGAATGMSSKYQTVNNALAQMTSSINYPNQYNTSNGKTASLYNIATQYYQTINGVTTYVQNGAGVTGLAASWVDTSDYPASGCSDSATPGGCLTDAQIQAEIQKAMTVNGWQVGVNNVYILYTSSGEGSCIAAGSNVCAYTYYCGYHSAFTATVNNARGNVIYANIPYGNPSGCKLSSQTTPNDVYADIAANVASHELIEIVTDPYGNAWFDASGNEIGDKCNFNFGSNAIVDPANGVGANQTFTNTPNAAYFELQREWSNAVTGCAQQR